MLTLFTTTVAAKELVMKCNENIYKYVEDPSGDKVFWKHKKKTKNTGQVKNFSTGRNLKKMSTSTNKITANETIAATITPPTTPANPIIINNKNSKNEEFLKNIFITISTIT